MSSPPRALYDNRSGRSSIDNCYTGTQSSRATVLHWPQTSTPRACRPIQLTWAWPAVRNLKAYMSSRGAARFAAPLSVYLVPGPRPTVTVDVMIMNSLVLC